MNPSSVHSISKYSISGCSSINEIIIPSSAEFIEAHAFDYCKQLSKISLKSFSLKVIDDGSFLNCSFIFSIKSSSLKISRY